MSQMLREWVGTNEGPLIVLPSEIAHRWRGIEPPPGSPVSDYDRACGVDGYLGTLDVGTGRGLVLGDEPMLTAFAPSPEGGLLVRWVQAYSMEEVRRAVPDDLWEPTEHGLWIGEGPLLIFDAAYGGEEPPGGRREGEDHAEVGCLEIAMPAGTYAVEIAEFRPGPGTWLVLHRLRRAT